MLDRFCQFCEVPAQDGSEGGKPLFRMAELLGDRGAMRRAMCSGVPAGRKMSLDGLRLIRARYVILNEAQRSEGSGPREEEISFSGARSFGCASG